MPPPTEKKISYDEFKKLSMNKYLDNDAERNGAHKMYQYTMGQKKKLCMDDEDFLGFITQKHKSLKKRPDLHEVFNEYRPQYKRKMEKILYPSTTQLEHVIPEKKKPTKTVEFSDDSKSPKKVLEQENNFFQNKNREKKL